MKNTIAKLLSVTLLSMSLTACSSVATAAENTTVKPSESVTLYITRHGKTMLNASSRMQGWCDSPLTADGAAIATKIGEGLKAAGVTFDGAYSSDSGRAIETAELALESLGQSDLTIEKHKEIREVCYGIYEGATPAEAYTAAAELLGYENIGGLFGDIQAGNRTIMEAVTAMAQTDETGTGETWEQAQERLNKGFTAIANEAMSKGQKNILVVSHGMAIGNFLMSLDPDFIPGELANASVTKLIYDGTNWTIEVIGDTSYIQD